MRSIKTAILALLVVGLMSVPAFADTYQLTQDLCTGLCNPGASGTSMGTVDVVQNGANTVKITVTLVSPLQFVNTGIQNTIDFNIIGAPTISASNFSDSDFSLVSTTAGTFHFAAFGDFQYSIATSGAQGAGGAQPSPVSFNIVATGLTPGAFATNGPGASVFFGVDVYNSVRGTTGPIGTGTSVPEPTSLITLGIALLGNGIVVRRFVNRKKQH